MIPSISVEQLAAKANADSLPLLVDVREAHELRIVNFNDFGAIHMPLSDLAARRQAALPATVTEDKDREIVVFCHHGTRSANVVGYLQQLGWTNVWNLAGGIDAYARRVDPTRPLY